MFPFYLSQDPAVRKGSGQSNYGGGAFYTTVSTIFPTIVWLVLYA